MRLFWVFTLQRQLGLLQYFLAVVSYLKGQRRIYNCWLSKSNCSKRGFRDLSAHCHALAGSDSVSVQLSQAVTLRGSRVILGTWPDTARSCIGVGSRFSAKGMVGSSGASDQQFRPAPALSANFV